MSKYTVLKNPESGHINWINCLSDDDPALRYYLAHGYRIMAVIYSELTIKELRKLI